MNESGRYVIVFSSKTLSVQERVMKKNLEQH